MYSNIVVATDGSSHASKAVELAGQLARDDNARLLIVHVVEPGPLSDDLRHLAEAEHLTTAHDGTDVMMAGVPGWMHEAVRAAERSGEERHVLDEIGAMVLDRSVDAAKQAGAAQVEAVLEHGPPARVILQVLQREAADLLVVGSRGLSDLTGLVLGSVSHRLAHLAPCTCITVAAPAD